jgi:bisphosphoglycerate-independent phosphoglycerate mutase (AlkP superfamily)
VDGTVTVVVTSDHGNLEDGRSTAHTTNPVPTIAIGPGRDAFHSIHALTDVAPAILSLLVGAAVSAPPGPQWVKP